MEKIYWSGQLDRAIVNSGHIPVDLLLNSEEEMKESSNCQDILFVL